jgi:hypothetical protein
MLQPALRVNEVRREDSVDQSALSEASLSNNHDVELKASLEQLMLNLAGDGVETDVGRRPDFLNCGGGHGLSQRVRCNAGRDEFPLTYGFWTVGSKTTKRWIKTRLLPAATFASIYILSP